MKINLPTSPDGVDGNHALIAALRDEFGFLPNLYGALSHSAPALCGYMALRSASDSLSGREHSVIALAVSQVNDCLYVLSEQIGHARTNGFSDAEIMDLRHGVAPFDAKLDALARLVHNVAAERGFADSVLMDAFAAAGYREEQLVDIVLAIGAMTICTYLANVSQLQIDFPRAPSLA